MTSFEVISKRTFFSCRNTEVPIDFAPFGYSNCQAHFIPVTLIVYTSAGGCWNEYTMPEL